MKKLMLVILMLSVGLFFGTAQEKKTFGGTQEKKTVQSSGDKKTFDQTVKKSTTKSTASTAKSNKSKAKIYKGSIASLAGVAQGVYTINRDDATTLISKGGALVFIEGKAKKAKLYFLIDQDGSFIGDKLANYAGNKNIAVKGWKKVVNGTNFIVVDFIESMD